MSVVQWLVVLLHQGVMVSQVFDSPLCIKFYLLTSVKSSYCVSWNPGNFGYSSVVQVWVDSRESSKKIQ